MDILEKTVQDYESKFDYYFNTFNDSVAIYTYDDKILIKFYDYFYDEKLSHISTDLDFFYKFKFTKLDIDLQKVIDDNLIFEYKNTWIYFYVSLNRLGLYKSDKTYSLKNYIFTHPIEPNDDIKKEIRNIILRNNFKHLFFRYERRKEALHALSKKTCILQDFRIEETYYIKHNDKFYCFDGKTLKFKMIKSEINFLGLKALNIDIQKLIEEEVCVEDYYLDEYCEKYEGCCGWLYFYEENDTLCLTGEKYSRENFYFCKIVELNEQRRQMLIEKNIISEFPPK